MRGGDQKKIVVAACDPVREEQWVEVGLRTEEGRIVLIDSANWQERMDLARDWELQLAKVEEDKVMEDIRELNRTEALYRITGSRRAVVSDFLAYLTWWLFTKRMIGLNSEKEAFDIILFTHPKSVIMLPARAAACTSRWCCCPSGTSKPTFTSAVRSACSTPRQPSCSPNASSSGPTWTPFQPRPCSATGPPTLSETATPAPRTTWSTSRARSWRAQRLQG